MLNGIQEGGISKSLAKRLQIQGESPVPVLTPELGTAIELEMPELLFHQGWTQWTAGDEQAAVAAQGGRSRLLNPIGTNTLVVVEVVYVYAAALSRFGTLVLYQALANLANVVATRNSVDTRQGELTGARSSVCALSRTTTAAFVALDRYSAPADVTVRIDGPWMLKPGDALDLLASALNTVFGFTYRWRERALNQGEDVG